MTSQSLKALRPPSPAHARVTVTPRWLVPPAVLNRAILTFRTICMKELPS